MIQMSLGLIETIGLVAAVEAADTAVKAANVSLVGYELARGSGMTTVKIEGDVGAVKAAVAAAAVAAAKVGRVVGTRVIARPASELEHLTRSDDTVGYERPDSGTEPEPPSDPSPRGQQQAAQPEPPEEGKLENPETESKAEKGKAELEESQLEKFQPEDTQVQLKESWLEEFRSENARTQSEKDRPEVEAIQPQKAPQAAPPEPEPQLSEPSAAVQQVEEPHEVPGERTDVQARGTKKGRPSSQGSGKRAVRKPKETE